MIIKLLAVALVLAQTQSCDQSVSTKEAQQQQRLSGEALSQTGLPAIKNFRERKLLKDIYELRDQDGLLTYTYLFSAVTGKLAFFCDSIGYGIPYSTEYTNPQQDEYYTTSSGSHAIISQADPNGLYSPSSADGTWIMCKDPSGKEAKPVYVEPRIVVSPFKLP